MANTSQRIFLKLIIQYLTGFWALIKHCWLETWHGYFAPLWILVWLAKYPFKMKVASHD